MEFRDLKRQYQVLQENIDKGILEVCSNANYISGFQVRELESQLAQYVGVKHCITCANGTDALTVALMAWNIGAGDAVFVPDFTFFSSGECPAGVGATPVFVDVDLDTYNMDPECLEREIIRVKNEGIYTPKVVVAVDLFGQCADYKRITEICEKYDLLLLEDGAQGFGGTQQGKKACSFGDIATTSFFPAKPLGCYGDGGAIFTDNDEWAAVIRSICVHGKSGEDKYNNIRIGLNSRLDTLQAAVLQVKFKAFTDYELDDINKVAKWYTEKLTDSGIKPPVVATGNISSWAQYTIQLELGVDRDNLQQRMRELNIPTMVYYVKPMHNQGAFENTYSSNADCPNTDKLCQTVLSLPIHPYMSEDMVELVCDSLKKILQ